MCQVFPYLDGLLVCLVRGDDLQELHLVHGGEVVHPNHLLGSYTSLHTNMNSYNMGNAACLLGFGSGSALFFGTLDLDPH